jgi:membrane-associated phospholipid phosphatase
MDQLSRRLTLASWYFAVPVALALAVRVAMEPALPGRSTLWFGLLLAALAVVASLHRLIPAQSETSLRWRTGLLFLIAINVGYQSIGHFLKSAAGWRADPGLWQADRALLSGRDAQERLAALNVPWLSDLLALAYLFFLVLLPLVSLHYVFRGSADARGRYWLGLMTVYGPGFAGYLLLPAAGPYLHHPEALPALAHGWVSAPIHAFIASQSTGVDVWPSLHAAVTLYIQFWLWRESPFKGRLLLPATLLVLLSTLYLQYHYLIDILCGSILAWLAWRVAAKGDTA